MSCWQVELSAANVDDANLHLFMVRSAAFATFAIFALNFLEGGGLCHQSPLYCISLWVCIQPAYVYVYSEFNLQHLTFYLFTLALVLILFRENKNEAKTIFVNEW